MFDKRIGWQIPSPAFHEDPQYYPDPDHFNPEVNFSKEARDARPPYAVSLKCDFSTFRLRAFAFFYSSCPLVKVLAIAWA